MRTLAGLVLCAVAVSAADSPGFTIGALRRDGVVIPFAAYDGKNWTARWPAPVRDPEIPINLRSIPPRWWAKDPVTIWATWIEGRAGASINVLRPDVIDAHCVRQVGLRTDYRSGQPLAPPDVQPYPKDGLAIAPQQTLESIETIDVRAPQLNGLASVLHEAFDKAERVTAGGFNHPVPQRVREQMEPQLEAVYAFGQAPRIYYVESHRQYDVLMAEGRFPFEDSPRCGMAFGTGWFSRDDKGFHSLDMSVRIVRCDKYGATYMLPFGGMHLGSRTYWIVQFSGWDHERYVVVAVDSKTVQAVINASGGGC
ncbi:MAG TPA: hypothetical protein VKH42_01450 [Vicinamibacterales bacterium]|nr:hypothetical protein [Vicinamibacterales bacterium]